MRNVEKILFVGLFLLSSGVFAQKFGIKGGLNIADIEGDFETGLDSRKGYHIGVFYSKPISEKVTIESGIALSTKGARFDISEDYEFDNITLSEKFKVTWTSRYLDFPIAVKYYAEPAFYLLAIPTISFLLDNTLEMIEMQCVNGQCTGSAEEDDSSEAMRTLDLGFGFGAGYDLTKNISLSASYTLGAITMDQENEDKVFNRVGAFSLSFQF